jgi:glycosyltransferase involved in cell wall biosynthesis
VATVPNGIRVGVFPQGRGEGGYLAFLGRISPEKRPDLAVEVARRSGLPLRVGAKVDPTDLPYWEEQIRPLFLEHNVDFLGELDHDGKCELLAGAAALVFPIDWPEPFGLVMVESLACGTPVVALNRGSVPEIIREGSGGFVGETVDDLVEAVTRLDQIDRTVCRAEAERFSVERMAAGYEEAYRTVLQGHTASSLAADLLPLARRNRRFGHAETKEGEDVRVVRMR